ncbi:SDR family oxidoreductase, partial [Microcella frigidaquae]
AVLAAAGPRLDGAVLAAGLGPGKGDERLRLIAEVNYFGTVELLEGWREALAAAGGAKVVIFSSNSTTTVPLVSSRTIRAFLKGDRAKAVASTKLMGDNAGAFVYAGSKIALTRWMRRAAVRAEWIGAGIRLNAVAPGAILTPLLQAQLDDPETAGAIESFPVPAGGFGTPEGIAAWVEFMLSPAADFLVGSQIIVDGGTDAYFRSDDWPVPVPLRGLRAYLRRSKEFAAAKAAR